MLDLRGNPGGLLEQAIQVSDLFLVEGTIVTTVGGGATSMREVKKAHADDGDDASSRSSVHREQPAPPRRSEIVAGALKNLDRAVDHRPPDLRQGLGAGALRLHRPDGSEQAALKLTIAQYLTPGDVSIQEVGITPDVAAAPRPRAEGAGRLFAPPRSMGEADLDATSSNPGGPAARREGAKADDEEAPRREGAARAALPPRREGGPGREGAEAGGARATPLPRTARASSSSRRSRSRTRRPTPIPTGSSRTTRSASRRELLQARPQPTARSCSRRRRRSWRSGRRRRSRGSRSGSASSASTGRRAPPRARGAPRAGGHARARAGQGPPRRRDGPVDGDGREQGRRAVPAPARLDDRREEPAPRPPRVRVRHVPPGERRSWTVPVKLPEGHSTAAATR